MAGQEDADFLKSHRPVGILIVQMMLLDISEPLLSHRRQKENDNELHQGSLESM